MHFTKQICNYSNKTEAFNPGAVVHFSQLVIKHYLWKELDILDEKSDITLMSVNVRL